MGAPRSPKRPANLTLNAALVEEARALGLNLSQAAEAGVRAAVERAREARWREENAEALASSNDWVEAHGLPLSHHRPF